MNGNRSIMPSGFRDVIADSLKGLAIILVVFGHTLLGFRQNKLIFLGIFSMSAWVYSFHMPLFFVISGYVHGLKDRFSQQEGVSRYIKKYAVDLYLPCIYFSLMYWLPKYLFISPSNNPENIRLTSMQSLFLIPLKGVNEYWFLCMLFFIKSIHTYCENKFRRWDFNAVLWLTIFIAAKFLGFSFLDSTSRLFYGFYFHAGFLISRRKLITADNHLGTLYGLILALAGFLFFLLPYTSGTANAFTRTAAAVCSSLALMVLFYSLRISTAFLSLCGMHSMIIYVLHTYVITSMRFAFRFLGMSSTVNPAVLFAICFPSAVVLPLLIVKLYQNVKPLRWIEYLFYPGRLLRH